MPQQPNPQTPVRRNGLLTSRRVFLRGTGVVLALPWLESLTSFTTTPAMAAKPAVGPPMRMATLFMPNGVNTEHWGAVQNGSTLQLSQTLQPLAPFADKLFVPHGLTHRNAHRGDGHYAKTANFLSGAVVAQTRGDDLNVGQSMDQLVAQVVGDQTPLSSLVLGAERTSRGVDNNVGFTRIYGGHVSWADQRTPVAKELYPRAVFDMLFATQQGGKQKDMPRVGEDASVLDSVTDDARRISRRISTEDRRQLVAYYDSIRQIERRINRQERQLREQDWRPSYLHAKDFNRPDDGIPRDPAAQMRLMLDLMVLAFRMNATRVASFMFGNAVSGRNMSFLNGVTGGHHNISHHKNEADNKRMYQRINQWHIEHLAYFLGQLNAVHEGEKTLLDNTMVLFGSGISDGNAHSPKNLPIVCAGGRFNGKTGDYKGRPLCALHLAMMQQMGIDIQTFGDADRPLT